MDLRLPFLGLLLGAAALQAQTVTIGKAHGWIESAYVEWQASGSADGYRVYCTGNGLSNQKLDTSLTRSYGSHWRADAVGLKAGTYTLKVVPVVAGAEKPAATTGSLTVTAHDRTGFAFSGGRIPGAYKMDGTLKDSAVVLYLSEKDKDAISLAVRTSAKGATTTFTGIQNILDGFDKGYDSRPLDIRVIGQVTPPTTSADGDILLENGQNASGSITLEGVGDDATANRWGVRIKDASNVEVRNLGIMNVNSTAGDDIGLQQDNDHVWIHNNDHFYGDAGSDADQVKGDGAMDVKLSTYVTISYDHFWDNGKSSLLGLKENTDTGYYITYHHNWFDHSDSRHPRVRFYSAHVYNNYYDGNSKYGAGSTDSSSVFMEANYFRNCRYPMMISMQGSDVWNDSTKARDLDLATFSNEVGGMIKAYNNTIVGASRFAPYGNTTYPDPTTEFDAYVVASRGATVPATVKSYLGSNTYNNFDVNSSIMYAYTADSPTEAVAKDTTYAGRIEGGDFKWAFDDAVDDTAHAVNAALKAAVTNYATSLVCIQGEGACSAATTSLRDLSSNPSGDPIRLDARTTRLWVADGWTLRSAEVFSLRGERVLNSAGSATVSLQGLDRGIYVARVGTDRGTFEKLVLKSN